MQNNIKIRDRLVKKGLVLGIIVLFVGASVTPSISGDNGKLSTVKDERNFEDEKLQSANYLRVFPASNEDISIKSNSYFKSSSLENNMKSNDQLDQYQYEYWTDGQNPYYGFIIYYESENSFHWVAQSFTPTLSTLTRVKLWLFKVGDVTCDLIMSIRSDIHGSNLVSISKSPSEIPDYENADWIEFDFSDISVNVGQKYFIVCKSYCGVHSPFVGYAWIFGEDTNYTSGDSWFKGGEFGWSKDYHHDFCFETYGNGGGNQPPVANPGGPYHAEPGEEIQFDGSNSYDPDGYITDYQWDFGDGTTGTGVKPKHTYDEEDEYTVTLTVTDNSPTRASSSASTKVPIWLCFIFVTVISATNDIDIRDIDDPIWIGNNPYQSKNISDHLDGEGSGSFTIDVKFYSRLQTSGFLGNYHWAIHDQTGGIVKSGWGSIDAEGSGHFWQDSFDVTLPPKVGKYTFNLGFWLPFYWVNIPQSTLYVTWDDPKLAEPKERWLEVATDWADGSVSEVEVAENLVDSEYANQDFGWIYDDVPANWEDLIDGTADRANCHVFARVWDNLAKVLGLDSSTEVYDESITGFVTSTRGALDNDGANALYMETMERDRWRFINHRVGQLANKFYDPTFGLKGYVDEEENVA